MALVVTRDGDGADGDAGLAFVEVALVGVVSGPAGLFADGFWPCWVGRALTLTGAPG